MSQRQNRRKDLRKRLKSRILARATSEAHAETIHSAIALNVMIANMREMRDIPDNHREALNAIDDTEFRSVRAANILAAALGRDTRITSTALAHGQSVH